MEGRNALPTWLALAAGSLLNVFACLSARADESASPTGSAVSSEAAETPSPIVAAFRHDASLADVFFVDRSHGWAVGDRGVIWHTSDGGQTWRQQESGVTCRLASVFFLDSRRGWIVGGESRPYRHATRGTVLRTEDGGTNWKALPQRTLPQLARVEFFDPNRGIAIGQATGFEPSGVFVTQDGGQTWQPLPADTAGGWTSGDFLDFEAGAVAGRAGRFATLARRQIVRSPLATPSLRSFHAMRLIAPTGGWLVGDGGVVMTTRDLGHSWQTPPSELPKSVTDNFDFRALAVHGLHVWVAGSPGTRVFHSPDGGKTWQAVPTGQWGPIHALSFADAEHGWAVGDFGGILATHDGGRSWQLQRSGGTRAALLAIFAAAQDVPLELLAENGAASGYLSAVELLHEIEANDVDASQSESQRTRQSMLLAGASLANTAWRFPLPAEDLALAPPDVLASLNRANDGQAIEQLERHLVRLLRMWRPDIVVTHPSDLEYSEPRAAILTALMMRAVEAASDPTRHVDLATNVGLPPWQVKKVYGLLPPNSHGSKSIVTGQFSPLLATTLSDFVSPARHLLVAAHLAPPDTYELELQSGQENDADARGLFSGIPTAAASEARRPQAELPVSDLTDLRRLAARRRHLEELMERTEGNAAWAGQVVNLTEELKANDGAALLNQLADGYRAKGQLDLAADTYYLLARRYPDHPLVDRALVWLVQFYASSEAGRRSASRGGTNVRQAAFDDSQALTPAVGISRDNRFRRAVQLAEYLKTSRPALYAEPAVRFAEVAAQRQLGYANPAKRYFLSFGQLPESDPWRQCAETEEWLAKPADLPPTKRIATCRSTTSPPHLDGLLDEPFWETADRLRLRGQSTESRQPTSAEARLAYDDEFLYLAVRCPKAQGLAYRADDAPRPRDADLLAHDRVSIQLDVDRDFSTAFDLTVDSRGWTHEACWGDAHWNPTWYVAAASDDTSWTVEAVIPLRELVDEPPTARQVWAAAVRRTIPRQGYETWAGQPNSNASPAQFGFLIFE